MQLCHGDFWGFKPPLTSVSTYKPLFNKGKYMCIDVYINVGDRKIDVDDISRRGGFSNNSHSTFIVLQQPENNQGF